MPERFGCSFVIGMVVIGVILAGCGGGSKGVEALHDGKVIVRNETKNRIKAIVYGSAEGNPVEAWVEPYETKTVSGVVPAGTKVEVVLKGLTGGISSPTRIKVRIDGNVIIRVLKVAYEGPIQYEITGG